MKRIFTASLGIMILSVSAIAQPPVIWAKSYRDTLNDRAYDVRQTSDGGYIIAGAANPYDYRDYFYLAKTYSNGALEWERVFGEGSDNIAYRVLQTEDGGFIIAGFTSLFGAGACDVYVVRTNAVGRPLWTRTYGGVGHDTGYCINPVREGGYIIIGNTMSFGAGLTDIYVIRIDENGNELWYRTYGASGYESGHYIQQTLDGGFIVMGNTNSYGNDYEYYLVKTDYYGGVQWQNTYGTSGNDGMNWGEEVKDGYVMVGRSHQNNLPAADVFLLKTDFDGREMWRRFFGGPIYDNARCVTQTSDQGLILAGYTGLVNTDSMDAYVIKTDATGNLEWEYTYGRSLGDFAYSVIETKEGFYGIVGLTDFVLYGNPGHACMLLLGGDGMALEENDLDCSFHSTLEVTINPFNPETKLIYSLPEAGEVSLVVYDLRGREIARLAEGWFSAGIHQTSFNGRELSSGVYFAMLEAGSVKQVEKLLLVK